MAASAATASSSPGLCPNYAVICSFLERYGALLDLPEFTFPQLERYLQDTSSVPKLLVDLHVKLLRKIGKSVSADRWEKYLVKLCQEFNTTWAWELEEKGYKSLTTESKTAILKYLCECQFDDNIKFKTAINEEDPDKMRLQPIGRDKDGQMYWFQLDQDDNVRLYVEEQDDLDGSSWKCIVKDRNDLAEVVALLKTQIDPELLKREELKKAEAEDGGEKEKCEVKKSEDTSDEEKDSNKASCPLSPKTEKDEKAPQKEKLKCEASEAPSSLNGVVESKAEADLCSENKGAKVQSIKEEPMEVTDTKVRTESSEAASDVSARSLVKVEKEVEAKKNTAEEIQQALKNDQQNKIPLKKRGMKFTEDFEKSSSNIVATPPVALVKDAPKADVTPEPTKKVKEHVNGESLPELEKGLHCHQTELLGGQKTDADAVKSNVEVKERDSASTEKEMEDKMDTACSESVQREVESHQEKSEGVTGENDSTPAAEEKKAHESPPPLKAESPPGPKDTVNNAPDKSRQDESENIKRSPVACEVEPANGDAATLTEGDETSKTAESEEQNPRQEVTSNEAESKDPEEKASSADMETSAAGETQEPDKSEEIKNTSDVTKTDVHDNSGEDAPRLDGNDAKPEEPSAKETPEVIKVAEAQCGGGDVSKETHDTATPADSKETETVKDGDSKETREVVASSSVIKKLDKPSETQTPEEKPDITATTETSVIRKVERSESPAPTENAKDDLKGTPENVGEVTDKTEETEKREDVAEDVNCEKASPQQDLKKSDSAPEPMEVEAVAVKDDLKTSEENGDKTEAEAAETKEETSSEGNNKSSQDEQTNVSEETREKATESENLKPHESPKPSETEQVPSEKTTECGKESGEGCEGEKSLNDKHPCQDDKEEEEKESAGGKLPKTDQSDENKQIENSDKSEKNELQGAESEKQNSTEVPSNKIADEENKSGKEETREDVNGDEAPVDVPKRGGRRRAKHLVHRRRAELQQEERQGDSESDSNTGMSLRRSPRISRPTVKAVEISERKAEKQQQATPEKVEKSNKAEPGKEEGEEEEEEEEEEEMKVVQKKPREKKPDQEGQPKPKGRKRRKVRWSNTRTRRKKKSSEDEENSEEESSEEDESEEEDTSDEDYKVERTKKRRNRNRERRSSDSSTSSDDDLPPNDDPCKHCGLPNHPELILLCDSCDSGYHTACLRPPLMVIPDGEWFCPPCQHKQLCDKLEEQLVNLDAALKKRERAERRKERLIYVGISLENIITPSVEMEVEEEKPQIIKEKKEAKKHKSWGQRSTRTKRPISYRFDEFDEAIEEAIEEDIKEAEGGGAGRGKDMANITGHRGKDMSTILQAEEGKENGRPPRSNAAQRKKKRRRLNDLDSDSTADEEESEEEFHLSESSEEEFIVSNNESEAETEAESNDSDFGSKDGGRHRKSSWKRQPTRRSSRKRRRPRGYSDDEEEETDEEEEEEIVTEGSSEFSDSDLDMSRRRSRRSQKPTVNYCETSESEGSQAGAKRPKLTSRRQQESSDSEVSFFRDSEEESREQRVKRRADSSEEDSRQRRRRLALKRRKASEDDDSDSSSGDSSSEDRPVRKRVNRIDSDDDDEEEKEQEEKPKEKKAVEEKDEKAAEEEESKGTNSPDCNAAGETPANGQSQVKNPNATSPPPPAPSSSPPPVAAAAAPPAPVALPPNVDQPKTISATPASTTTAAAPNGMVGQEMAAQDEDEDDLLGVTDLVDYVCNNEEL